jgi:hypothetical protein
MSTGTVPVDSDNDGHIDQSKYVTRSSKRWVAAKKQKEVQPKIVIVLTILILSILYANNHLVRKSHLRSNGTSQLQQQRKRRSIKERTIKSVLRIKIRPPTSSPTDCRRLVI